MGSDPENIGPYRVERRLGRGGMGVVYVCRHPMTPRPVAVKQTLARGAGDKAVERFKREAALLARVKHPGVVAVHTVGQTADGPYLVMELVEGQSLDRAVRDGPLDPTRAARLVRDLASAVAAVHAAGVIHRDIKPANVMLRADGSPVLLDFGLAREVDAERLTRTGEVLGTLAYMPPEQAGGRSTTELDGRVDVYALGALLYELLAARPPYAGGGIQVLAQILGPEEPPSPSSASESSEARPIPAALEAIVRVAMAKRREDRYATARAVAADLERFLAGVPPLALQRARPRRRAGLVAVALLPALGVAALVARRTSAGSHGAAAVVTGVDHAVEGPAVTEPPSLWVLPPDAAVEYDLEFAEEGGEQTIRFGCRLALRPEAIAEQGPVRFACEVTGLSCRFGLRGTDGGLEYRSDQPDPSHPLSFLQAAVGRPFECVIEPRTGAVLSVRGFDAIRARVAAGPREGLRAIGMTDAQIEFFIDGVFNDRFIGASMDALTHVRGAERRVPWRGAVDDAAFLARPGAPRMAVLPSLTSALLAEDRFLLAGTSRYRDGRVQRAELTQELVQAGGRSCVMRWSMTASR